MKKEPLKFLKVIFITIILLFIAVMTTFILINSIDYVEVRGEIKPLEYQDITPKISGIIKKCYFKDGDPVYPGNVVLEMDSREYELSLASLDSKRELLITKSNFLKSGMELMSRERTLLLNKLKNDLNDLDIKKNSDIISQKEYDDEVYKLRIEEISGREKYLALESEMKQSARELDSISADIESIRDKIDKCRVVSRIDGIIVDEDNRIKEGTYYNSGEIIQKIFAGNSVYAEVYIPDRKVIKVQINQKVKLFIDAVPYNKYRTFDGRLVSLKETKTKDQQKGYIGKVLIEDPFFKIKTMNDEQTRKLIFGLTLNARIYTGKGFFLDFLY